MNLFKALQGADPEQTSEQTAAEAEHFAADTSMDQPRAIGLTLFALVFGVFGGWAALAPIEGAAFGPGTVTVRSYSKVVQHLEGGIIETIHVQNGDYVEAGQPLLVLDDTQPLAQLGIANAQYAAMRAREARLLAERDGLGTVSYPADLSAADADTRGEMQAQDSIFNARKAAQEGSMEVLEQRIEQLQSVVVGLEALKTSKQQLAASFAAELTDTRALLDQGFSDKNRLRQLERNVASYEGEAADLTANISSTEVQIGETRLQILQENRQFHNLVVTELGDTQTQVKDLAERVNALRDVVARTVVRAPEEGIVNGMQFHTVGGVIGPGSTIAQIVPQQEELIIEAQVSPIDIDRVAEGQEVTIRFSSFGNVVPSIYGTLVNLSADAIDDATTGNNYYLARIEVNPEGMEELGDLDLLPGMPAEVFIATGSRTFLQYLFKPFSNAIARSFNED